jgi:hypothetical protein
MPKTTVVQSVSLPAANQIAQRAALAVELIPELKKQMQEQRRHRAYGLPRPGDLKGALVDLAGERLGVGRHTVQMAARIQFVSPAHFEKLKAGKLTLAQARRELCPVGGRLPSRQDAILDKSQRERLQAIVGGAEALCMGFERLDLDRLASACTQSELHYWSGVALRSGRQLRLWSKKLQTLKQGNRQ